ncbi:hypothetical protein RD792_007138 [Penstemon davidsonii]|uniref:Citrate synthase n=1 Tax=Penstemon davidsonii TaxID=160366 RepID=A0ABR0D5N3_9LAMI|nr:hypothetical protein RD792_007138 [Penstemon davidsonii]
MESVDHSTVARGRLSVLAAHLSAPIDQSAAGILVSPSCSAAVAPPTNLNGSLSIIDERIGKSMRFRSQKKALSKPPNSKSEMLRITTGKNDKGLKVYDPGYFNTAPVRSSICYIDGDEGILRYRGYPIEELAEGSSFLEVAYLLMYGNLPTEGQLAEWEFAVSQHSAVPQGLLDIIQAMPHDAHPMGVLVSAMSALSVFHPDANPALRAPTIAAAAYLRMAGRTPVLPSSNLSYSENFLYMLDSLGNRYYKPNPRLARVLDILFILHAEHEMNSSTAAARHLASSVDVYTAVSGVVGALYGPLHGGANEAVLKMLSEIGSIDHIPEFIEGVKNRAMGFPTEFFPVLFAIPRMAGYLSHWRESLDDADTKIMRPAQVYTGLWLRHYTPQHERTTSKEVDKLGQVSVSNATRRRLTGSGA